MIIDATFLIFFGIVSLCMFFFLLTLFNAWKTRRLRKKYNEEEDLSKVGERHRLEEQVRGVREKQRAVDRREPISKGFDKFERGFLLSSADSNADGTNEDSVGETSDSPRNFFERLHKR